MRVALLALMFACLGACSFIGVTRPVGPVALDAPMNCTDSNTLPVVDTAFAVAGFALAGHTASEFSNEKSPFVILGWMFVTAPALIVAVTTTASAVYGYTNVSACKRSMQEQAAAREASIARRQAQDRAWTQTQAAALAARSGDCATVAKLEIEVRSLDGDFHRMVFVRDAAIARCLGTPTTP